MLNVLMSLRGQAKSDIQALTIYILLQETGNQVQPLGEVRVVGSTPVLTSRFCVGSESNKSVGRT